MTPAKVIDNPLSGERIVIRTTAEDTAGSLLEFDLFLPPGSRVPAGHTHPVQEERFTVVEGLMRFRLGLRNVLARPGETVVVPPETAHWFSNPGDVRAHVRVEVRPALRTQELFEAASTLGGDGARGRRVPRPVDLALFLQEFALEVRVPFVPASLARTVIGAVARLGRRRRGLR
jgi:quercetin dioxygenase-like cupin family protein